MHSDYLEQLFLNNDFAEGRYIIDKKNVMAENIRVPAFVVTTEKDHVAPWKSVYKIHTLINSDITFILTNGGHNSGIVSEPGHKGHSYHVAEQKKESTYLSPSAWLKKSDKKSGSWWLAWHEWLIKNSSSTLVKPPVLKASLPSAPGRYVLQK
jgi:polyhydroxyalkanoate synthase